MRLLELIGDLIKTHDYYNEYYDDKGVLVCVFNYTTIVRLLPSEVDKVERITSYNLTNIYLDYYLVNFKKEVNWRPNDYGISH